MGPDTVDVGGGAVELELLVGLYIERAREPLRPMAIISARLLGLTAIRPRARCSSMLAAGCRVGS
jgi:hypothetical protein